MVVEWFHVGVEFHCFHSVVNYDLLYANVSVGVDKVKKGEECDYDSGRTVGDYLWRDVIYNDSPSHPKGILGDGNLTMSKLS